MVKSCASPATVARNLMARREELCENTIEARTAWLDNTGREAAYTACKELWLSACKDVRDFKALHPSAFEGMTE
jgi:hypothetical protein